MLQHSYNYLRRVWVSSTLWCRSEVCLTFSDMPAKAATLLQISEPMSHILTEVLNIAQTDFIATGIGIYMVIDQLNRYVLKAFQSTWTSIKYQQCWRYSHQYVVLATVRYLKPASFIGLHGNRFTTTKSMIFSWTTRLLPPIFIRLFCVWYAQYAAFHGSSWGGLLLAISSKLSNRWNKNIDFGLKVTVFLKPIAEF